MTIDWKNKGTALLISITKKIRIETDVKDNIDNRTIHEFFISLLKNIQKLGVF